MAHIQYVAERNQRDPDDRQHGFLDAVWNGQRAAHECQAGHGDYEGCRHTVTQGAPPDRDCGNQRGDHESPAVEFGGKEELPANSQAGNKNDRKKAMKRAQAGKADPDTVETPTNRRNGALQHVMRDM